MVIDEVYAGEERRARDRSEGIQLRRRSHQLADEAADRRRSRHDGYDIAGALELHLDQVTTRRGMVALLESWLTEARDGAERDEGYVEAVEHALSVMKTAPDAVTGIAMLQRQ